MKENKNSIIAEIAEETGVCKKQVKDIVNCFIRKIKEALLRGDKVLIKGLGTFYIYEAKPRIVNDFQKKGSRLHVGKRFLPKFRFSEPFVKKIKEINK